MKFDILIVDCATHLVYREIITNDNFCHLFCISSGGCDIGLGEGTIIALTQLVCVMWYHTLHKLTM